MSVHENESAGEEGLHDVDNDTIHQGCYIYVPQTVDHEADQRPAKRRKTANHAKDVATGSQPFPPLLRGQETTYFAERRHIAFQTCWTELESRVTHLVEPADSSVLDNVIQFVRDTPSSVKTEKLSTGLIVCGSNVGSQARLLDQWKSIQGQEKAAIVVQLDSAHAPNLMTAVRDLIHAAIVQLDGVEGYQRFLSDRKRRIPMNYDLELLQEYVASKGVQKCVVYMTDIETFDIELITDIVSLLHACRDRIPFVLLLGVSTTVELFEARLPKSTIRLLECQIFDATIHGDPCFDLFSSFQLQEEVPAPSLGPAVTNVLLDMAREQDASAASFGRALKYATMSHFFANALSILSEPGVTQSKPNRDLCEAIRSTDSFRKHVEDRLDSGEAKLVQTLLNDDKALLLAATDAVYSGQKAMTQHHSAVELLLAITESLDNTHDPFTIQAQALSGPPFFDSTTYTDLLSQIPTLRSNRFRTLLQTIQDHKSPLTPDVNATLAKLNTLAPPTSSQAPLRTAHDPTYPTTTTTVSKNNQISLAKHGPKLSAQETAYTSLVDEVVDTLSAYFESHIINPATRFMHEVFLYDAKSPLNTAFAPRPRFVVERALTAPHDYLGCECCNPGHAASAGGGGGKGRAEGGGRGGIQPSQPPTSILWQLWCEAGGTVNVRDLWDAFAAIVVERDDHDEDGEDGVDDDEEEEEEEEGGRGGGGGSEKKDVKGKKEGSVDERMALALFYRGLAELRMLGFVKGTKRKADCLAKTAWRGL